MTHYFLYIKAGVLLDEHTAFYKVACGDGQKGAQMNAWLEAYAAEHGHFFVRWSLDAVEFYERCQISIGPNANDIKSIAAADLIKSLKTGCEDPCCYEAIRNRHHMMMQLNPHYYIFHELSKRK